MRDQADTPPTEGSSARRTKDRLLLLLKTRGPQTTKALAAALGVSVPATRAHLKSLGGSVVAENRPIEVEVSTNTEVSPKTEATETKGRAKAGRPAQIWSLTEQARDGFPDTHSELTVRIIDSIEQSLGPAALDAVIEHRYRASEAYYRSALEGVTSLAGRLKRLTRLRAEEGYMAQLERRPEGWLLVENHCPICAAASRCQGFCSNELKLFESVLGSAARIVRAEYLLDGDRRCAYLIKPAEPAG